MITFRIDNKEITLDSLHWIDARFVVADHPETGKPALFLRGDEFRPFAALNRLGMRFASGPKSFNGINYYELEANDGSEKDKDVILHRDSGHEGVQGGDHRDVVTKGIGEVCPNEAEEGSKAA